MPNLTVILLCSVPIGLLLVWRWLATAIEVPELQPLVESHVRVWTREGITTHSEKLPVGEWITAKVDQSGALSIVRVWVNLHCSGNTHIASYAPGEWLKWSSEDAST
ncbi:MAG: hypothetical protein KGL39_36235 [Patescibacteria group bacterium]|nr:hypothetical protein [Patescibacteria group bacterium]